MQRAEQPVPDSETAAEVLVEVDRIGRMMDLMMRRADQKAAPDTGERDPEAGVVQVRQQIGKDDNDGIATGDDELRRLLAEGVIHRPLRGPHAHGQDVVEHDAVHRMHTEVRQR